MKKTILAALSLMALLLIAGAIQNIINNPTRGCTKYNASANYTGYDCGSHTIYRSK